MFRRFGFAVHAALAAALVAGCGGDSGTTLSGTAAVGTPIAGGDIAVRCVGGSALATTSGSDGSWTVRIAGHTLPCAVQVSGGTIGGIANPTPYHSIAVSFGTINVTPLTDLVVAHLAASNPQDWFAEGALSGVTSNAVSTALSAISTALGLGAALGTTNPLTTPFAARSGDRLDDLLEAMRTALSDFDSSHMQLRTAARNRDFTGFAGFDTSFSNAFANIVASTGSGSTGSSGSCASGETRLAYSGAAGLYSDGQEVCFAASATTLAFSGRTLASPVQNTAVSAPYSAYKFTDTNGYAYEVIFNGSAVHEINLLNGSTFAGQFAPATESSGSGSGAGSGTASLTVEVQAAGVWGPAVEITGVPAPANEAGFCNDIQTDSNLTGLGTGGGTLTIDGCSFSGNIGTVSATVTITSPVSMAIPYTVRYTYH